MIPDNLPQSTLLALIGAIFAWGVSYARLATRSSENADDIVKLEARLAAVEKSTRTLDRHEMRLDTVETRAASSADALRSVEKCLNALASDMRVTREILERLEKRSN